MHLTKRVSVWERSHRTLAKIWPNQHAEHLVSVQSRAPWSELEGPVGERREWMGKADFLCFSRGNRTVSLGESNSRTPNPSLLCSKFPGDLRPSLKITVVVRMWLEKVSLRKAFFCKIIELLHSLLSLYKHYFCRIPKINTGSKFWVLGHQKSTANIYFKLRNEGDFQNMRKTRGIHKFTYI